MKTFSQKPSDTLPGQPPLLTTRAPQLQTQLHEIFRRVADKWTRLARETLREHGKLRFTRLGTLIGDVSQKMWNKSLRQREADGLV